MLTLNEALRADRLEDFIAQAEADGIEAADRHMLTRLLNGSQRPYQKVKHPIYPLAV